MFAGRACASATSGSEAPKGRNLPAPRRGACVAIASVQEFDVEAGDRSTTNYDAVTARLREQDPPKGLILHTAGFTPDDVFRVFSVWESAEDAQSFTDEVLMPMMQSLPAPTGDAGPPDRQYVYPLHDLQRGR
jgi:hypothetical protein